MNSANVTTNSCLVKTNSTDFKTIREKVNALKLENQKQETQAQTLVMIPAIFKIDSKKCCTRTREL
jgi:hypothetical protein